MTLSLAEAGVAILDCEHKTPTAQSSGFPYIAIPDIRDGRVDIAQSRLISDADLAEWTRRTTPRAGDVLVTRRGRVGDTAPIPRGLRCAIGQNLVLLRSDGIRVDQAYLRWATRSPQWWSEVDRLMNVGAIFSSLNVKDIARIRLDFPPLPEQQAIAEVLGALDDKIAANTALVAKADELRHSTFRSLAVRQEVPLSQTAAFINGKAFTKGASGTGRVVVRIAELNGGISGSTVFSDAIVDDKHVARPGDILFAWSGSLTLHRWYRDEAIVNQHIFKVTPAEGYPAWFTYELLRQKLTDFKAIAADKATTMGHIQRHHLDEIVGVPSPAEVDRLNPIMSALWGAALNAEQESLTLAATRDALLPQLMSGKLRVRDAEKTVSEVL